MSGSQNLFPENLTWKTQVSFRLKRLTGYKLQVLRLSPAKTDVLVNAKFGTAVNVSPTKNVSTIDRKWEKHGATLLRQKLTCVEDSKQLTNRSPIPIKIENGG